MPSCFSRLIIVMIKTVREKDIAKDFTDNPIYVIGTGQGSDYPVHEREDMTSIKATKEAARHGKIINISSVGGKEGYVGLSHYCASKFAVIGIIQSLVKELAEYDINANAVCPGILHTQMWEGLLDDMSKREELSREQIFSSRIGTIPLKRPQTPEDIANVVLFLSSEVSKNITGEASE